MFSGDVRETFRAGYTSCWAFCNHNRCPPTGSVYIKKVGSRCPLLPLPTGGVTFGEDVAGEREQKMVAADYSNADPSRKISHLLADRLGPTVYPAAREPVSPVTLRVCVTK